MLKKLNLSIGISALSLVVFFIIKTMVLLEVYESTRFTTGAEFILLLIFAPFYIKSINDLINRKTEKLANEMTETEKFIDTSNIISKADAKGKITYVNDKFVKVSGYSLQEVLGKNHNIVNSGFHTFHHDYPQVHWSKLPELHRTKIDPYIKPEYNQNNIIVFLYKYLIKGKL